MYILYYNYQFMRNTLHNKSIMKYLLEVADA